MRIHQIQYTPRFLFYMLLCLASVGWLAATSPGQDTRDENSFVGVVTGSDVYIRCGADRTYYPIGRAQEGDMVLVTTLRYDYQHVAAVGPTFDGLFGYVIVPESDAAPFRIEADGKTAHALGAVKVMAPNLDTDFRPKDSWKRMVTINADETVTILETTTDNGNTVYKVVLPKAAGGWIHQQFVRRANPDEIQVWEQALAGATSDESAQNQIEEDDSVEADEEAPPDALPQEDAEVEAIPDTITSTPDTVSDEGIQAAETLPAEAATTTPASESEEFPEADTEDEPAEDSDELTLDSLEAALVRLQEEEDHATAEVHPLRQLYISLADQTDDPALKHYASSRAEQLAVWDAIQSRRADLERVREQSETQTEMVKAMQVALANSAQYVAIGQLDASTIFDGSRLPRLLRLQDPGTGRTIAYLRPTDDFDLVNLLGQLIGVTGEKKYDGGLRLNLIQPERIDILAPQ